MHFSTIKCNKLFYVCLHVICAKSNEFQYFCIRFEVEPELNCEMDGTQSASASSIRIIRDDSTPLKVHGKSYLRDPRCIFGLFTPGPGPRRTST